MSEEAQGQLLRDCMFTAYEQQHNPATFMFARESFGLSVSQDELLLRNELAKVNAPAASQYVLKPPAWSVVAIPINDNVQTCLGNRCQTHGLPRVLTHPRVSTNKNLNVSQIGESLMTKGRRGSRAAKEDKNSSIEQMVIASSPLVGTRDAFVPIHFSDALQSPMHYSLPDDQMCLRNAQVQTSQPKGQTKHALDFSSTSVANKIQRALPPPRQAKVDASTQNPLTKQDNPVTQRRTRASSARKKVSSEAKPAAGVSLVRKKETYEETDCGEVRSCILCSSLGPWSSCGCSNRTQRLTPMEKSKKKVVEWLAKYY